MSERQGREIGEGRGKDRGVNIRLEKCDNEIAIPHHSSEDLRKLEPSLCLLVGARSVFISQTFSVVGACLFSY
jgi:hypothetical protein